MLNGIERREERMYRILRPTLHSSAKPQYTRYKQLTSRLAYAPRVHAVVHE